MRFRVRERERASLLAPHKITLHAYVYLYKNEIKFFFCIYSLSLQDAGAILITLKILYALVVCIEQKKRCSLRIVSCFIYLLLYYQIYKKYEYFFEFIIIITINNNNKRLQKKSSNSNISKYIIFAALI
jgi:hypothetical protein